MKKDKLLSLLCCLLFVGQLYAVDGGEVSTPSGETTVYTCPGDGNDDKVMAVTSSTATDSYAYIVTNDKGLILALPSGNEVNLEGAGTGVCRIYGVSFTGDLTIASGTLLSDITSFSTGESSLSTNFIATVRDTPLGGEVSTLTGETVVYTCPGDGVDDVVMAMTNSSSNSQYRYIVTDSEGVVLGVPPGNSVNVEGAGGGTCRIYGLSFTGNLTVSPGDVISELSAFSDDCSSLSTNFIATVRSEGNCVPAIDLEVSLKKNRFVKLNWSPTNFDADKYFVVRRDSRGRTFVLTRLSGNASMFTDFWVRRGETYSYWIYGVDKNSRKVLVSNEAMIGIGGVAKYKFPFAVSYRTGNNNDLPQLSIIPDFEEEQIGLYPNPVQNRLELSLRSIDETVSIQIIDASGQQVLQKDYKATDFTMELDTESLKSGLHIILIDNGLTPVQRIKFAKQ